MTIETNLGKEKVDLDKDALVRAYYEFDELYIISKNKGDWNTADRLNKILLQVETATGFEYFRTIRKRVKKENK